MAIYNTKTKMRCGDIYEKRRIAYNVYIYTISYRILVSEVAK